MRRTKVGVALLAVVAAASTFEIIAAQTSPVPKLPEHSAELNSRGRPRVSPRRTAMATIDGVFVGIEWGSPSKRNRVIWGELVPFGRWWMPGADETTTITTNGAIQLGDLRVPSGVHSIYTMPAEAAVQLIINRGTDLFHTEYPERLNLGRVPMTQAKLAEVVEQLTFGVEPTPGAGGVLKMSWDDRAYSVALTVPR